MRLFINTETGEQWTEDEIRQSYAAFRSEMADDCGGFEEYLDNLLLSGSLIEGDK